jgi:hypothetical protein
MENELRDMADRVSIALVLPALYAEFENPAMRRIADELTVQFQRMCSLQKLSSGIHVLESMFKSSPDRMTINSAIAVTCQHAVPRHAISRQVPSIQLSMAVPVGYNQGKSRFWSVQWVLPAEAISMFGDTTLPRNKSRLYVKHVRR